VVVSDTRARRSARRRINVFMARRGGVSVNKALLSACHCLLELQFCRHFRGRKGGLKSKVLVRVGCRSLCFFFFFFFSDWFLYISFLGGEVDVGKVDL
jgi:hypothetical protein